MFVDPQKHSKTFLHNGESFLFRPFRPEDLATVRTLVNAAYKELADMGLNYTATYQDEETTRDRISKGCAFVLERHGEVVGTILFSERNFFTNTRSVYLSQLAVRPDLKRGGLGSIFIDHCEAIARAEGYEALQFDTAKPAHHLVSWYQRRGSNIIGTTQWEGKTYESWIFEKKFSSTHDAIQK